MYIVNSEDNVVLGIGETFKNEDKGLVYLENDTHIEGFQVEGQTLIEVENIPKGVEPFKTCYTKEKGFYDNPDWQEPNKYGVSDETVAKIIADNTKLLESIGVLGGAK